MSPRVTKRALGALALVAVVTTGCAALPDAPESESRSLDHGSIARDTDLHGAHFTVGSKEFTEQVILGKIMIYALRAAGADTTDQTGLSGSTIARTALRSGEIDMYWEYAGTGWSQFLGNDKPVEGDAAQYEATAKDDRIRNGIEWLGPARFGNQYAIARAADAPGDAAEVDTLGELADFAKRHPEQTSLCGASEFLDRELSSMQDTYGFRFPAPQVYQNAFALNYVNVAKASPCTFAEVFTTDARIKSLNLEVLEDEKTHFSTELAALTTRSQVTREHPELTQLTRRIGDKLTKEAIIELNGMVDLHGATPDEAALHFLKTRGFI